jgi:cell division protein FtsZ
MLDSGNALMGIGESAGENRAVTAARAAISSPLLDVSINGAKGILYNVTGGTNMTLSEISDASMIINQAADPDANIIFGAQIDESMGDKIKISVIATGFEGTGISAYKRPSFGAFDQPTRVNTTSAAPNPMANNAFFQATQPEPEPQEQNFQHNTVKIKPAGDNPFPSFPASGRDQSPQQTSVFTPPTQAEPTTHTPTTPDPDEDEFDIPAFLRKGR